MKPPKHNTITFQFLKDNPDAIFVFGDNSIRTGTKGAAAFRYHPQAVGFITKKYPNNQISSYYTVEEYRDIFESELKILEALIDYNQDKHFFISPIGSGLANRYQIFEKIIDGNIQKRLSRFKNITFLWESSIKL